MLTFDKEPGEPIEWKTPLGRRCVHLFEPEDIDSVLAALAAERPLLVRGEPGVGKSQLAMAAAVVLKRAYVSLVVDSRTEVRDLRWTEDLVARLADAQMAGLSTEQGRRAAERVSSLGSYTYPGPLWWGFQWKKAEEQMELTPRDDRPEVPEGCDPRNGAVVLIDEIDKSESDLPNGLLEALGARRFRVRDTQLIEAQEDKWPLVVITTNDERQLPDAFLRRCLVHDIELPKLPQQEEKFLEYLKIRGAAHFPDLEKTIVAEAARMTMEDRSRAIDKSLHPLPGFAEFIDLLAALNKRALDMDPEEAMRRLRPFFLQKHPELRS